MEGCVHTERERCRLGGMHLLHYSHQASLSVAISAS